MDKNVILKLFRETYGTDFEPETEEKITEELYEAVTVNRDAGMILPLLREFENDNAAESNSVWLFEAIIGELDNGPETAGQLYRMTKTLDSFAVLRKLWTENREWLTKSEQENVRDRAERTFDRGLLKYCGFFAD